MFDISEQSAELAATIRREVEQGDRPEHDEALARSIEFLADLACRLVADLD